MMGEKETGDVEPISMDEAIEIPLNHGEPLRLITLVGGYRHKQLEGRRFMLELGNPAVILLLAYLLTLPGIVLEFFLFKNLWYFGFDLYSVYVFLLSTGCVIAGIYLIFRESEEKGAGFKIDNLPLFAAAASLAIVSLSLLIIFGRESAEFAIALSILIVISIIMGVASSAHMKKIDLVPFSMYGIGVVIVALVPVHQAFGIWGGGEDMLEFTIFDGALVVIGVTIALIALNAVKHRSGLFAAWLIGATLIALISFHELAAIKSSGSFEIYDQVLALEGSVFSLVPLSLYFISEFRSARIWTYLLSAMNALNKKNHDRALVDSKKAMELVSNSGLSNKVSLPWSVYGDVFYRMGKLNKAKTFYDMALQIDPKDYETWSNLGTMYAIKGYEEQALVAFQKAVQIKPDDPRIWNNLGVVLLSLRQFDDALASFRKALDRDPSFPVAHYNAGTILLRFGKPSAAMRHFEKLIEIDPDDENARRSYERTAVLLDYFQQAAGWKLLGLNISELIKTVIESPSKFEDNYEKYLNAIVTELSPKVYGKDRERMVEELRTFVERLDKTGMSVMKLKADPEMTINQLRFSIAILSLANKVRFKSFKSDLRVIPLARGRKEKSTKATFYQKSKYDFISDRPVS